MNKRRALWAELISGGFQIHLDVRVGVFVDRQARRSVLDENVQNPHAKVLDLGKLRQNIAGDQVKASALGRESNRFLVPERQICSC